VEVLVDQLLENNQKSYWVPDFVQEKRFHNWLKDAKDWNVSRNRYWGTPIPLWVSDDMEEVFFFLFIFFSWKVPFHPLTHFFFLKKMKVVCIGSVQELKELSGIEVTDLHRERYHLFNFFFFFFFFLLWNQTSI